MPALARNPAPTATHLPTGAGSYTATQFQADCQLGYGGDRTARTRCNALVSAEINRLYPVDGDHSAPGCLTAPTISRVRALVTIVAAIARAPAPTNPDAVIMADTHIIRLYPCGIRRF